MSEHEIRPFEEGYSGETPVRGQLHVPANLSGDAVVLTHGAGSNCDAPLLKALAASFCESGMTVLRCDLPFRQLRPHGPPSRGDAEGDQRGLRRAVEAMKQKVSGRVFLGGHSYGGRQASMLASSEPGLVEALLLLSYPLHPPKRPAQLRTAHFPSLLTPALFVHGTRDGFGSIEEMTAALKLIPARTQLLAIEGAGHELMTARNRADLPKRMSEIFLVQYVVHSAAAGTPQV
jgi:predicted alpha/beta-hydrolase family hydrolase